MCRCGSLGKCDFFIYLWRVVKETRQTELLSYGHGKRRQIKGTPPFESGNVKDQGYYAIGGTLKDENYAEREGFPKGSRASCEKK